MVEKEYGFLVAAGLTLLFASTGACDWGGSASAGTAQPVETKGESAELGSSAESGSKAHYSSFGIRTNSDRFEVISFKDVGLGREDPSPADPVLEVIAQSVAYQLNVREDVRLRPRVFHDSSLADPEKHTYCEAEHVYVDLWRSESPDKWGYSLWSGCSETQKFAGNEVAIPEPSGEGDVEEAVAPLTEDIADSLATAIDTGCFRRAC